MTPLAKTYLDQAVAVQRLSQPIDEIGIWAGASLLNGYCLRRVEENEFDLHLEANADPSALPGVERLDEVAQEIAADLRGDEGTRHFLGDDEIVLEALDRIINSEIQKRIDHWRETIDAKATAELEEYLTWWVVKGYALRVAETATGALV